MSKSIARNSFILHLDSLVILDEMTNEQAGIFLKSIKQYQITKKLPDLDFGLKMAITPFINQFIRDEENYKKTCEARRLAGGKGGKQKVANASKSKQKVANLADSDSKSDSDSKNKKDSKSKNFTPPTLEEVKNYCQERKNSVNPEKFFDYYSAGNWKDAKGNSVKNWKQKLLTWESKDPSPTQKDSLAAKLNSIAGGDYFKSITLGDKAILNCNVGMKTKLYSLPEEIRQKIKDEFKQPIEIN